MATTPNKFISPQSVFSAQCTTDTANTTYSDSPTNTVLLVAGGTNGKRLTSLVSVPRATVTATMLQLYSSKDAGTTKKLIKSVLMGAHTVAATTAIPGTDWGYNDTSPLIIEAGEELYIGQAVTLAAGIVHDGRGGAY